MFTRTDLNVWLAGFLTEHVDPVLGSAGFRRRAGTRSARRRTGYGAQKIEFFVYLRPSYAHDQAHLVIQAQFFMPEVMRLARDIFGPSADFAPDPGFAGGVDLDSLRDGPLGLWLFGDESRLHGHAPEVRRALRTWVLPFLDASSTLDTYTSGPARDHLRAEIVAAAYVQLGQPGNALDFLRQRAAARSDLGLGWMYQLLLDSLSAYLAPSRQHP